MAGAKIKKKMILRFAQLRHAVSLVLATTVAGLAVRAMYFDSISRHACGHAGSFYTSGLGIVGQPSQGVAALITWEEGTLKSLIAKERDSVLLNGGLLNYILLGAGVMFTVAFLELLGVAVGSRGAGATTAILGLVNFVLLIACGATPIGTRLVDDVAFTQAICIKLLRSEGASVSALEGAKGGTIGDAAVVCLIAAAASFIQAAIGVTNFLRAKCEKDAFDEACRSRATPRTHRETEGGVL